MIHMWCSFSHGAKIWMAIVGVSVSDIGVTSSASVSFPCLKLQYRGSWVNCHVFSLDLQCTLNYFSYLYSSFNYICCNIGLLDQIFFLMFLYRQYIKVILACR